jgi:hypothetical protein
MQIRDSRTGLSGEVEPARGRPLLVCVHLGPAGERPGLGDLRACLVADLLFRTLELGKAQVLVGYASEGLPAASATVKDAVGLLGIHPPTEFVPAGGAQEALGGPIGVHVVAPGAEPASTAGGVRLDIAPAGGVAEVPGDGDPLALRLALLGRPYGQPVEFTPDTLTGSLLLLDRWRQQVATWARTVSRPIHPATAQEFDDALRDGLDTATALRVLQRLETATDVPDGSRFETFVYADRVLGLELPRDIGRG